MSTPTRCHHCDMPQATREQRAMTGPLCEHGQDIDGDCPECGRLCWFSLCQNPPVDWRARCLQAEAALSLLSAPLSTEALQALVEESAE